MNIPAILHILLPCIVLAIAVYELVNILIATPVDAEVVGHRDTQTYNQGSGGWHRSTFPVYSYTFNGETKTTRSKYSHFSCKEGDMVRIYVSKSGKIYEKEGVIYPVLFAVVLFLILLKM